MLVILEMKYSQNKNKKKSVNDERMIKIIQDELEKDDFNYFELQSIISMTEPKVTSVIVNTGYLEMAIEIDKRSGKIISKEKIARQ